MHTIYGLSFLYAALPVALAAFLLTPPVWRSGALLLLSLGYYLLAQPSMLLYTVSCIAIDWAALLVMERFDDTPPARRCCLAFSALKSAGVLVWFEVTLREGRLPEAPLGLSVVAISGVWCVYEVYKRKAPYLETPVPLALYCCFFPRLYSGPLMPYSEFAPQLETPSPSIKDLGKGAAIFIGGAVKTGILSIELEALARSLRAVPEAEQSAPVAWCAVIAIALGAFYRFSGYTDMARGVGRMMGLLIPESFYYPYQSAGVEDFFERFHSGAGRFFRAILPQNAARGREALRVFLAGAGLGLFLGLRVNFLIWGLYLAFFAFLEGFVLKGAVKKIPTPFKRIYTFFIVMISFAIFGTDSPGEAAALISDMFDLRGGWPLAAEDTGAGLPGYILSSNWLLIVISLLFATSVFSLLMRSLRSRLPKLAALVSAAVSLFLLFALTAYSA
ncbi:MAG: hypothetical protein LBU86_05260 [Oscillospiraceae bacterium]|jgi:alginate O-acetyltransferase complex protein AlgI|nr:hypothetical protein [Oscillospiraceae bacterium]